MNRANGQLVRIKRKILINVWVFKIGQEALLLCTKAECSICSMNNTFLASYILDSRMIVRIKICLDVPFQERSYLITNNRHDKLYKLLIQVSISIFSFNPPASNHNYSFFFSHSHTFLTCKWTIRTNNKNLFNEHSRHSFNCMTEFRSRII